MKNNKEESLNNRIIAEELKIALWQVENTLQLLEGGATVPFISRYRKEKSGGLDETQITAVRDRIEQLKELDKRKLTVINSIKEQDKLTPELEEMINKAITLAELEDIYLPYKPKKKTRASIAKEKGLEPLAKIIISQNSSIPLIDNCKKFINQEKGVNNADEALAGARDIIAEWINENLYVRNKIRKLYEHEAKIHSKVVKDKEKAGQKYANYFDWEELLHKTPSHRILAIFRGEKEAFLKVKISIDETVALFIIENKFVLQQKGTKEQTAYSEQVKISIKDSYKRLLAPSIETEIRAAVKQKADKEAIKIFTLNLRQLLLAAPLGQKNVMAIDPGFRTGCKVVCLNPEGRLVHNETIYPHPPQNEIKQAAHKIITLVKSHKTEAIAIGNGTAGRETETFIKKLKFDREITAIMVNESGASVYSASAIAREEFPDFDITVRGAVSIGRRLMDPLAELVKIDPKSIGIGQYQHDVDQNLLHKSLEDVVISCVNLVGVELNTASKQLLSYISGVGKMLAENIIKYRNENGAFKSRDELKKVSRFGIKAFEQSAGFLRIRDAVNPLDRTAVHPESYAIVEKMAAYLKSDIAHLVENKTLLDKINPEEFVTEQTGLPTLKDILAELVKPCRDPRADIEYYLFDKNIKKINDLVVGKKYPGIVTNLTAFGAFVDLGIHQDGLIHISQICDKFIKEPSEVLSLNQKLIVKVIDVDIDRKRIQLSLKE